MGSLGGVAMLGDWSLPLMPAAAFVLGVLGVVVVFLTWEPCLFDLPRIGIPVGVQTAILLGLAAEGGSVARAAATVAIPLTLLAAPWMLRLWGLFTSDIQWAVHAARVRAKIVRWIATPARSALLVRPVRIDGDDLVLRVDAPGPERQVVAARTLLPGSKTPTMPAARFLLAKPVTSADGPADTAGYRDTLRERILHVAHVHWVALDAHGPGPSYSFPSASLLLYAIGATFAHAVLTAITVAVGAALVAASPFAGVPAVPILLRPELLEASVARAHARDPPPRRDPLRVRARRARPG